MGLLDTFEVMPFVTGIPSMSVTKDGVSFNKTVIEKLNSPAYVLVLIDKINRRIALRPCNEHEPEARPFLRNGRSPRAGVRWNNSDLKDSIRSLAGWDLETNGYKVSGQFFPDDQAMIFNLNDWTVIERRNTATD